ncbi:MarR family winged helix-turn-helix transcriptional regulator [Desulforhopalus sp. IMCC35007]|uniref:MarR family winged helix-turn-helix transcriptional regulator n=1 Tax=Desulforhopalus sp. IMCC35007 TaxID=2569543 RepID=UPI0010AE092C|nr:MarR family winged helix-turn-helix transcriptional regulator [Desulforhopalus sp. IMCC35007]TKB12238.1 winged helix-turn-helix transcriptional regulator [Desulforhopalus sp. IMCC35007]
MPNLKNINDNPNQTYDVDESFPILMATCVKYMREALNASFAERGYAITSEQWILLCHLASQDGVSQLELARRSDKTEVSTLNLLKKLEVNDLVIRRPDPVDGRSRRVYLTSKGRKLQKTLIPMAKGNIIKMTEGLDVKDIDHLKTILRKITDNLKNK